MKSVEVQAKLPSDQTPEAKAVRSKLFDQFDPNGNGYLSLAEVDRGVRDVLGLDDVFHAKAAIMRAFEASKNVGKSKAKYGADFVERSEFRLLLLYLGKYYELYEMFESVDSSGDKRINKAEFKTAAAHLEKGESRSRMLTLSSTESMPIREDSSFSTSLPTGDSKSTSTFRLTKSKNSVCSYRFSSSRDHTASR